jgi:hypothetical protein
MRRTGKRHPTERAIVLRREKRTRAMSNISVRKENGTAPSQTARVEPRWEPMRMMRDLLGWDPFRETAPFLSRPLPRRLHAQGLGA